MSKQKEYIIEGMSCASCAMTIENAVSKMPGVDKASVNLATEIMTVEANDSVTPEISGRRTRRKERKERSALKRNEEKPNHFSDFRRATSLYRNGRYGWNSNASLSKPNAKPCELRVDSIGACSPNYLAWASFLRGWI